MPEINLRRELVKWFLKRSHWVVVRTATIKLSGLVDQETGQVSILGRGINRADGKPYTDILVKSDRRKVVPDNSADSGIGDMAIGADHFYFEHHIPIKEGDIILEIELESNGDPVLPVRVRKAYKVVDPEDMRDGAGITAGRLEFLQCKVEQINAG